MPAAISRTSFLPSNITTNQDAIRPGSSAHPSLGLAAGGERILSFHWLTATCMEMRMTGDSHRLLCDVDLWLTALKPASSEPELRSFFFCLSPCSSPKTISQTFPSAPLSEAQSERNSQKIRRICMLFLHFLCLLSVLYQDFAPSVQCYDSFSSFLASMSIQGAASLRVESLSPCPLLPQTLPSGSAPPNSQLLPSSLSGSRRLAQRSKA